MLFCRHNFGNNNLCEWGRNRILLFHFKPGHRHRMAKRFAVQCWVDVLTEPGFRELHGLDQFSMKELSRELRQKAQVVFKKEA